MAAVNEHRLRREPKTNGAAAAPSLKFACHAVRSYADVRVIVTWHNVGVRISLAANHTGKWTHDPLNRDDYVY
jgi:hypothetical protein